MDTCAKCGNKYASGDKCVHWHCDNYDEHYSKTLKFILFKNGVNNIEDLKRWIDVFVPEKSKSGTPDNMAAWFVSWQQAEFAEKRTYDVAFLYYHGLPRLKDNPKGTEEDFGYVKDAYSDWPEFEQELIDFMESGGFHNTP